MNATEILLRDHAWSTLSYSEVQQYLRQLKDPLTASVELLGRSCREYLEKPCRDGAEDLYDDANDVCNKLAFAGYGND